MLWHTAGMQSAAFGTYYYHYHHHHHHMIVVTATVTEWCSQLLQNI